MIDALTEHNERLFDLEFQWNDTALVGETLASSRLTAPTQALSATETLLQQLVQQVAALTARTEQVATVQPPRSHSSATTISTSPPRPWRQWNKYCYWHGVNLNHDTAGCNFKNIPEDKKGATPSNPLGGNTSKNRLWMKWCHPVTHKAHDQRE